MASKTALLALSLVGFLCLTGAADLRKALDDLLRDDDDARHPPPPISDTSKFPFPPPPPVFSPPPSPEGCFMDGVMHKPGQRFANEACTALCKCRGPGAFACVSLCPPMFVRCRSHQRMAYHHVAAWKSGSCKCKRPYCVDKEEGMEVRSVETKKARN